MAKQIAGLMARASKIGAAIYKALPPGWRQFCYKPSATHAYTKAILPENMAKLFNPTEHGIKVLRSCG